MRKVLWAVCVIFTGCGTDSGYKGDTSTGGDAPDGMDWTDTGPDIPIEGVDPDFVVQPEEELCGESEFNISRVIPDILILLDRSNSMSDTPPVPPLWDTIRQAITEVTSATDDSIWYGLMIFPNSVGPNACQDINNQCVAPAPTGVLVPVGPDTSGQIESVLSSMATCGGTPIAMSLRSAHQYLMTVADDHPRYVLLSTDGAPNCNETLNGSTCRCTGIGCVLNNLNCLDDARTYSVLDELCASGIITYVLGMGGATSWTDVLSGMAIHGCSGTYFTADDPDSMRAALEEIAGAVASCQFELDCSAIPDPDKVNFYFDGTVVPMDVTRTNGWNWVDTCDSLTDESGIVEFTGSPCDTIMGGGVSTVSATFGCPTFII